MNNVQCTAHNESPITCGTPRLVDVHRGTLVVLDTFVGEALQALLALHCVAALVLAQHALLLLTLGARPHL